jgi:hypothetical protein
MASKMPALRLEQCADYKTSKRLIHDEHEYARITNQPAGWRAWLRLKNFQYNVTSALYMLDWWEQLCFNAFIVCVFGATTASMYVYCHSSLVLFTVSMVLFLLIGLVLVLCPLHQY